MTKKAQNEIIGFALIIIIVSIVGLIFFSLSIGKNDNSIKQTKTLSDFIESSKYYTTDCATNFVPQYKTLGDLIKSCYKDERCLDNRMACEALNSTIDQVLEENFFVGEQNSNKAFKFKVYYKDLDSSIPNKEILNKEKGIFANCTSELGSSGYIFAEQGNINIELDLCLGK
jgi:hypothetical protein